VTAKDSNGISALGCSRGESELTFVVLRDAVCKAFFGAGFDLARVLKQQSICTVLVVRRTTFACFETDNACMMGEERIDPPPGVIVSMKLQMSGTTDSLSGCEAQVTQLV
jgi:hypothetical protein